MVSVYITCKEILSWTFCHGLHSSVFLSVCDGQSWRPGLLNKEAHSIIVKCECVCVIMCACMWLYLSGAVLWNHWLREEIYLWVWAMLACNTDTVSLLPHLCDGWSFALLFTLGDRRLNFWNHDSNKYLSYWVGSCIFCYRNNKWQYTT